MYCEDAVNWGNCKSGTLASEKKRSTAKTEIIENATLTLDLPLLVRSVVLPESRRAFLTVFYPNLNGEILDVLAPFSIISVFAV